MLVIDMAANPFSDAEDFLFADASSWTYSDAASEDDTYYTSAED